MHSVSARASGRSVRPWRKFSTAFNYFNLFSISYLFSHILLSLSIVPLAMNAVESDKQDEAWRYLQDHADITHANADAVNLKKLRTKIDWHILPLMFCCYTLQFIDKVIINVWSTPFLGCAFIQLLMILAFKYAAVMGITADLKLVGNEFSNASTSFFIAFLIAEVPNSEVYLL